MRGVIIIEGHVQGLSNTRAIGEQGIPVVVVDKDICLARFSRYCKKFFYCPDYTTYDFIDFLINLAKKENLQDWILIPSNDHIVKNISIHKDLISKYFKTIVPDYETLQKIINKKNLIEIAQSCSIPIPKTYDGNIGHEQMLNIQYPVLVKGNQGLSFYKAFHSKAIIAKDTKELLLIIEKIKLKVSSNDIIIQELIEQANNKVVSFTAFTIDGVIKAHWTGVKIREHPIKFGTATLSESIVNVECFKHGEVILNKLKYTGVSEIEFLFDPKDSLFKLIEINPRTWLWVGLAKECGINYAMMIYNYLNGISMDYPVNYKIGIKWVNYLTDTTYCLIALLKRKLTIPDYFKQLKGEKITAIFSKKDLKPWLIFLFLVFYIAKKRG